MEWFSAVPDHWDVLPCRAIVDERNEKNEGLKSDFYLSLLANIGIIPYEEKGDIGNKKPEDLEKCKLVERGDLVINSMNYGIGSFGLSELSGVCSPVYIVLRPKSEVIEERFALRIFECRDFQTYAQSFGNGILAHRAAINWDILKVLRVPVPPRSEQNLILQYLDQETGKIDALVAEQERLIALLKEKRQAVISQAVTKGLNSNAPMKDSGIEWLGQVPAHWRVGKAGFYLDVLSGFAFPSEGFSEDEQATRLLRGINVSVGEIRWDDVVYWHRRPDDQLERYLLRQGDLVIGMDRPWIAAGVRVARLGENDTPCLLLQRVARLSVNSKLNDEYLYSLLASDFFTAHFSPDMTGVSVPHISPDQIKGFVIPIPPIAEQHAIISHLKTVVEEIDTLITEATQAITLLRERRAALISAAVTGKIDVRSLAPTKQEAA